jgi:hypothetical protein
VGLMTWRPETTPGSPLPKRKISIDTESEMEALTRMNYLFISNSWGDRLPILSPTDEGVDRILRGIALPRTHILGKFPPRGEIVTAESCAIALAMHIHVAAAKYHSLGHAIELFSHIDRSGGLKKSIHPCGKSTTRQSRFNLQSSLKLCRTYRQGFCCFSRRSHRPLWRSLLKNGGGALWGIMVTANKSFR